MVMNIRGAAAGSCKSIPNSANILPRVASKQHLKMYDSIWLLKLFWNVMLIISSASGNWRLCSILQLSDGLCPHFFGTTEYLCGLIFMYWWCLIIDHFLRHVLPWHLTPASALWLQLWIPMVGCLQSNSLDSFPKQCRLSRNIPPVPRPKWENLKATAPVVVVSW